MRAEQIKIHNMGPFRDAAIDIAALPGRIIACRGPNGAGKTMALELIVGAIFRECPTRGPLMDLATGRDAHVEVRVANGDATYQIRQSCDPVNGKSETLILGADGAPVIESAKVRESDRWLAQRFPPASVLFSGQFAVQKCSGMFDLSRADRVRMLNRALGLEHLETLAQRAGAKAKSLRAEEDALRDRIADLGDPDPVSIRARLERQEIALEQARSEAAAASDARARAREAASDQARARELFDRRKSAELRRDALREQLAGVERRAREQRALADQSPQLATAMGRARAADSALADCKAREAAAESEYREAQRAWTVAKYRSAEKNLAVENAGRRLSESRAGLLGADEVRGVAGRIPGLEGDCARLESEQRECEAEVARIELRVMSLKDDRIGSLRAALKRIQAETEGVAHARAALAADDRLVVEQQQAPAALEAARERWRRTGADLADARRSAEQARTTAARLEDIERLESQVNAQALELAKCETALCDARRAEGKIRDAKAHQADLMRRAREARQAAGEDAGGPWRAILDRQREIESAAARLDELRAQCPALTEQIEAADREIAKLPKGAPGAVDLVGAERACERAAAEMQRLITTVAVTTRDLAGIEEQKLKLSEMLSQCALVSSELDQWHLLATDLGRDRLQALELDAAFPELSAIANDLLHTCHGPRFTLEFSGYRMSADGRKAIEDPDVTVIDSERGNEGAAQRRSGGEFVVVNEAVSLALTVVACRRLGIERPTIVRDESGSALDSDNLRAWITMLRRAAEAINADKVLVVSHVPEIWDMCDAQLVFGDGKIEVQQ